MPDVKHYRSAKKLLEASVKSLKFPSALALEKAINDYFDWCELGVERSITKKGEEIVQRFRRPPTLSGLALWLGFGHVASLRTYLGHPDFHETMQRGMLRVQCALEEQAIVSKTPAGSIALLQMQFGHMTAADKAKIELKKEELDFRKNESISRVDALIRRTECEERIADARVSQSKAAEEKTNRQRELSESAAEFSREIASSKLDLTRNATERRLLLSEQKINLQVNVNSGDGKVDVAAKQVDSQPPTGLPAFPPKPKNMAEWLEWYEGVYGVKTSVQGEGDDESQTEKSESDDVIEAELVEEHVDTPGELR